MLQIGAGADVEFAPRSTHNGTHVLRNATEQYLSIGVWVFSQAFGNYGYQRWWKIWLQAGQEVSKLAGYGIKTLPGAFPVWAEITAEIIKNNVPTGQYLTVDPIPLGTVTIPDLLAWGVVGEWTGGGFTFPQNSFLQHTVYVTNRTGKRYWCKVGEYLYTVDGGSYIRHDFDGEYIEAGETRSYSWNWSVGSSVGARKHMVSMTYDKTSEIFDLPHVIVT